MYFAPLPEQDVQQYYAQYYAQNYSAHEPMPPPYPPPPEPEAPSYPPPSDTPSLVEDAPPSSKAPKATKATKVTKPPKADKEAIEAPKVDKAASKAASKAEAKSAKATAPPVSPNGETAAATKKTPITSPGAAPSTPTTGNDGAPIAPKLPPPSSEGRTYYISNPNYRKGISVGQPEVIEVCIHVARVGPPMQWTYHSALRLTSAPPFLCQVSYESWYEATKIAYRDIEDDIPPASQPKARTRIIVPPPSHAYNTPLLTHIIRPLSPIPSPRRTTLGPPAAQTLRVTSSLFPLLSATGGGESVHQRGHEQAQGVVGSLPGGRGERVQHQLRRPQSRPARAGDLRDLVLPAGEGEAKGRCPGDRPRGEAQGGEAQGRGPGERPRGEVKGRCQGGGWPMFDGQ